ncbi:hypothetical protein DL96DRAFT_1115419 [Flagelloscypha sp. PMI_526]|nr:hypothetical protein DL96DRAFT_1115419 [Flagelloscypha sp. PMI_526]
MAIKALSQCFLMLELSSPAGFPQPIRDTQSLKKNDLELLPLSRRHVLQPTAKDFIVLGKCNISGYEVCPGHSFSSSNSELSSANASTIPIMSPSSKPSTLTLVPLSPLSPRDMNASMGSTKSHPCLLDLKSQQPCPDKNGFFDSQRNPRSKSFPKLTSSWI